MRLRTAGVCSVFVLMTVDAQNTPVVNPRGVINAFTQQPPPTRVAPGGIIWISGISLGPPEGVKAAAIPWPTQLGEPPIQAMVNGRAAPNGILGGAGIIQFDPEQGKSRLLPTPEGFAAVQIVAVFPATRKIVAHGVRTGNTGALYLICLHTSAIGGI